MATSNTAASRKCPAVLRSLRFRFLLSLTHGLDLSPGFF
jgi:hypothetical protein